MATNATIKNNESSNKSLVMKAAWSIFKKAEVSTISEAMKLAWKAVKLKIAMASGVVKFQYRKATGEIRTAIGTLKSGVVNYVPKGTTRKPCYSTVAYWDIEKKAFRSFCISHLI